MSLIPNLRARREVPWRPQKIDPDEMARNSEWIALAK